MPAQSVNYRSRIQPGGVAINRADLLCQPDIYEIHITKKVHEVVKIGGST